MSYLYKSIQLTFNDKIVSILTMNLRDHNGNSELFLYHREVCVQSYWENFILVHIGQVQPVIYMTIKWVV
jgi:hypothetical protein